MFKPESSESTRLERLVIALIHATGDPFKNGVAEIVRLAGLFESEMDGVNPDFKPRQLAAPDPSVAVWYPVSLSLNLFQVLESAKFNSLKSSRDKAQCIVDSLIAPGQTLDIHSRPEFTSERVSMTRSEFEDGFKGVMFTLREQGIGSDVDPARVIEKLEKWFS